MANQDDRTRLRRTMMLTPGNQEQRLQKATTLDVDAVIFDLEDGVAPDRKAEARSTVAKALQSADFGWREKLVRINAVDTDDFMRDVAALPFASFDTVFVPKVESAAQLVQLDHILSGIELSQRCPRPMEIIATIETPRGLFNALAIADASPRTTALFFGSGDYSAATGGAVTVNALAFARSTIVAAAAAANLQAIDAAYFTAVKDAEATAADARLARELGFTGKVVFHPIQVGVCNDIFSPSTAELERAHRIVEAHRAAAADGRGVAYVNGEFLAIDIVMMAERVIRMADLVARRASRWDLAGNGRTKSGG